LVSISKTSLVLFYFGFLITTKFYTLSINIHIYSPIFTLMLITFSVVLHYFFFVFAHFDTQSSCNSFTFLKVILPDFLHVLCFIAQVIYYTLYNFRIYFTYKSNSFFVSSSFIIFNWLLFVFCVICLCLCMYWLVFTYVVACVYVCSGLCLCM
jgi:hypothetical protein